MPLNSFTPQQTQDPLLQRIQEDLRRTLDPIVKVLNALNPTISPGTTGIPAGTVQLQGLPAPGAKGGVATLDGSGLVPSAQIPDLSGTYQPLSGKDAASGYAGLTAGSLIKVAELTGLAPSFATIALTTVVPASPVANTLYAGNGRDVLIQRQTATGTPATLDFTTGFGSAYEEVFFHIDGLRPSTTGDSLWMRISLDGSTFKAGALDYCYAGLGRDSGGTTQAFNSAGAAQILVNTNTILGGATLTNEADVTVHLKRPSDTAHYKFFDWSFVAMFSAAVLTRVNASGTYLGTTSGSPQGAILGVRFMFSTGTIAEGSITQCGRLSV